MNITFAAARQRLVSTILMLFVSALAGYAQSPAPWSQNTSPLPAPTGFVNDYAGVIDPATKEELEKKITALKQSTNPPVELAVAVVRTTGERDIFDYSLAVARGWGIGTKEDDNPSALLFIAIDDRKYFTQVSKDLEDELPDGVVGSLQRQFLVPEFKKGNYAKGVKDTIDAYISTIESYQTGGPPPVAANRDQGRDQGGEPFLNLFCCLGLIVIVLIVIFSNRGGGSNRRGGGGGGLGGLLPWIILAGANSGSSGSSWGGGSSGWSGGGGGGGWGGFGGGGDFGGGGAGGGW